jgi:hypothetical protein
LIVQKGETSSIVVKSRQSAPSGIRDCLARDNAADFLGEELLVQGFLKITDLEHWAMVPRDILTLLHLA